MSNGSRIFHASFIKLITNTSSLCFFLRYATTSPTTLANMQSLFPLADPFFISPFIHETLGYDLMENCDPKHGQEWF